MTTIKTFKELALQQTDSELNEYYKAIDILSGIEAGTMNEGILDKLSSSIKKKIDFIKQVATATKYSLKDMLVMFKNSKVFAFFKKIGFNIMKLIALIKKGFDTFKKLEQIMVDYIKQNGGVKWVKGNLDKLDEYLQNHPTIKKFAGVAVAGLLIYIWTQMSFTPDLEYSMSWEDIILAVGGNFSIAELFAGDSGILMLTYLATGVITGLSMPWPGKQSVQILSGVMYGLYKITKPRLKLMKLKKGD